VTTKPSARIQYWLVKSEPDVYSIDDLRRDGWTPWSGVRNYQARNFIRDMRVGDRVLFYHSNAQPPGVVGTGRVSRAAYPDATALDPASEYYDPRSTSQHPIWLQVDVAFVSKFKNFISLDALRAETRLTGLMVLKRGMRLSIQPVCPAHFRLIRQMGGVSATR
jgi:predicted RNA-binding protein with PUA-like domain